MWGPGGPSQWGGPDVGPRGRGGEPNNWGPPPQGKPGGQGNWGAGNGGGPMQRGPNWDGDSPPVPRRAYDEPNDMGTDIWGAGKGGNRGPAPPGGE